MKQLDLLDWPKSKLGYFDYDLDLYEDVSGPVQDSPRQERNVSEPERPTLDPKTVSNSSSLTREDVSEPSPVNIYSPAGKETQYFRYTYRQGSRVKHRHIPGGNTTNPLARARAEIVREAVKLGYSTEQILWMIGQWPNKK